MPNAVYATVIEVLEEIFLDDTKNITSLVSKHGLALVGIKSRLAEMVSDDCKCIWI